MSTSLPSDEVADDYKNSLDDLITNDRYQISTLTLIAKENIEHAEAISRILQNHIQRTPPARKLPALYVLDSIVKNVGTPYTVYFGRNLHTIYMYAYSQVDMNVRRKLEEMLKTWREPVPGSLATSPVFPISSTQPIVDSLNRYRASSTPQSRPQAQLQRPVQVTPFRDTPTPPLHRPQSYPTSQATTPQYGLPPSHQSSLNHRYPPLTYSSFPAQIHQQTQQQAQYAQSQAAQQFGSMYQSNPTLSSTRPSGFGAVDMAKLHEDIDDLTTDAKIECATHPMDQAAQTKLASLQSLREILDSGNISEKDLIDIRNSILQQKAKKLAPHRPTPPPVMDPRHAPLPMSYLHSYGQPHPPPPSATPSFINSTDLAELLKATSHGGQAFGPTYGHPSHPPQINISTPPMSHAMPAPLTELPLLAQLRASGLLSTNSTPPQSLTPTLPSLTSGHFVAASSEVQFTSASVKIPRPQLITSFLNTRPNQCSTCGRRFTSDELGKQRKAQHLDWHFKTKARMLEAEARGQNRSWYVDEREWIASREYEDDEGPTDTANSGSNGLLAADAGAKRMQDYVRAPTDPILRNAPCPIDQENFKSEWSEELQDFIWKDTILVGGRYYHASCYREVMQDREKDAGGLTPLGAGTGRTGTPDSVLGKRKADGTANGGASRFKVEVI